VAVEEWHLRWTEIAGVLRAVHKVQVQRQRNPKAVDQALEALVALSLIERLDIPESSKAEQGRRVERALLDALRQLRRQLRRPISHADLANQAVLCWCLHVLNASPIKAVAREVADHYLAIPRAGLKGTGWAAGVREQTVRTRMWPRGINAPHDYLPGTAEGLRRITDAVTAALEAFQSVAPRPGEAEDVSPPLTWFERIVADLDSEGTDAAKGTLMRWTAVEPAAQGSHLYQRASCLVDLAVAGIPRGPVTASAESIAGHGGPLVERESELAELDRFLASLLSGTGGTLLLEGEAGVGKTRLLAELSGRASTLGVPTIYLVCAERASGLQPWRQLLGPLWAAALRDLDVGSQVVEEARPLLDLLIEEQPIASLPRADEDRQLDLLVPLIITILRHASARQPLLVMLDDVHWIDPASLQLVESVQAHLEKSRVGLVAAFRPTVIDPAMPLIRWRDRLRASARPPIEVPPFGRSGVRAWLTAVGRTEPSDQLVELALARSGGRALLLKHVSLEPEGEAAPHLPHESDLHPQVLHSLLPSLEQRTDACRTWLEAAAVEAPSQEFDTRIVERMLSADLRPIAGRLVDEARIARILAPDGRRFENILWRDVIVGQLPIDRRRRLHARAFRTLQRWTDQRGGPSTEEATRLAVHAWEGRERLGADAVASACLAAARVERRSYAYDASVIWCERGIQVTDDPKQRYALLMERGDAQYDAAELSDADASYAEAAESAAARGDRNAQARAALRSARLWRIPFRGNQDLCARLEAALEGLDDHEGLLRAQLEAHLAGALASQGADVIRREQLARSALQITNRDLPIEIQSEVLLGARWGLYDALPPDELLELSRRLRQIGARLQNEHLVSEGLTGMIVDQLRLGRLLEARATIEEHREHAHRNRRPLSVYLQHSFDSMMATWEGKFDRALELIDQMTSDMLRPDGRLPLGSEGTVRQAMTAQVGWLLHERGQTEILKEQEGIVISTVEQAGHIPMWRAALALLYCDTGRHQQAAEIVAEIARESHHFSQFPPHGWGVPALFLLAEICDELRDETASTPGQLDLPEMAVRLQTLLEPHLGEFALGGTPAVLVGPVRRAAGLAALVAGDPGTALRYLEAASREARPSARPTQARLHLDQARAHLAHRNGDDWAAARRHLDQAVADAEQLGMHRLGTRAQELLDGLGG
jgi:hypothetical protein